MSNKQGLSPKIRNLPDLLTGSFKIMLSPVMNRQQKMKKIKSGFNSMGLAKYVILFLTFLSINAVAQNSITVKGIVRDTTSGLPGAVIKIVGATNQGVATDNFGRFEIRASKSAMLSITCVGFKPRQISLASKSVDAGNVITLDIRLESATTELQEVAVTGFGNTQKKASMVSSITTVNVKDLKTPSSNLTNALAGRIAGVIAFQNSGEPGMGTDNSTFYIRGLSTFGSGKRDPLILIDGVESSATDMARLQPDDISDFSVLKDAAASSVYGARGANGVVLINTKMGMNGKPQFNFRVENRISRNTRDYEFADNITYMKMANEASITRTPNGIEPYSQNKINSTAAGEDPYLYPNNNWLDQLIKKQTVNQGYNLNISGGTNRARYYIAGTLNQDNGNLKVNPINNFNNNIRLKNYSIRTNIDFDLTKSTVLVIRMYGQFDDYQGPIGGWDGSRRISGGEQTFRNALNANPVMFPAVYPSGKLPFIEHPLFGSAQTRNTDLSLSSTLYTNPYAEMVKGYQVYKTSNLQPQLELKQDLAALTTGLSARAMGYLRRTSFYRVNRNYDPFFYSAVINAQDQSYNLTALNDGGQNSIGTVGTEVLNFSRDAKEIDSRMWLEGSVNYNRTFNNKHAVGGMLVSYLSDYENANVDELIQSLPSRNAGVSGRFSYGYDDRYLAEFNFGYNGSERFDTRNRWGFFPSVGVGYRISNEKFFEPLRGVISSLKFRATYGVAGNDAIGRVEDRFFYMSRVSLNDYSYGASFGRNDGAALYTRPGVSISRYANADISWERSTQLNIGMDLTVGKGIDVVVDVYKQKRTNILQPAANIDNAAGLMATTFSNFGEGTSKGVDMSGSYRANISRDFSINARGTFTYATTKIGRVDELPYPASLSYLSRKGTAFNQAYGYIAERLFVDDEEVANSPVQFGDRGLRAGDIKYRDINGDGVINTDDQVALGYPTEPEITYGFGSSFRYKKFDFSFYFQGSARFSFFIDSEQVQPFYQSGGYQTGLLKAVADNYWTETNPNLYAFWPRLSTWRVPSNNVTSTWWMRNGNFLRLKNVEFGYTSEIKKLNVRNIRFYLSATNLFMLSKFKMWDAEMRGKGMNYPLQSLYNLGLQVSL